MLPRTARFQSLLEAVPDALVGVDQGGVIRFLNRRTEAMFGYDSGQLIGRPVDALVPESFRTTHPAHRGRYATDPGLGPWEPG